MFTVKEMPPSKSWWWHFTTSFRVLLFVLPITSFVSFEARGQDIQCIFSGTVRLDSLIPPTGTVVQLLRSDSSFVRNANYGNGSYGVSALQSDEFSNGDLVRFRVIPPGIPGFIARTNGDPPTFEGGFPPVLKTVHLFRNRQPRFLVVPRDTVIDENQSLQIDVTAVDPDADPLAFHAINFPLGAVLDSLNPTTRRFRWTPDFTQSGQYNNIQIRVTDGELSDTTRWNITVHNVNRPPVPFLLIAPSDTIRADSLVIFRWNTSIDPDGDTVRYSLRISSATSLIFRRDGILDSITHVERDSIPLGILLTWRVFATDRQDTTWSTDSLSFIVVLVGIHDQASLIPLDFKLHQNYPNPFNPSTAIRYEVPHRSLVNISIYDVLGQQVAALVNEEKEAGRYEVVWDGRNENAAQVGSGVYFYRMQAGEFMQTRKFILLR